MDVLVEVDDIEIEKILRGVDDFRFWRAGDVAVAYDSFSDHIAHRCRF